MYVEAVSPGRLLGSVALRYQWSVLPTRWPPGQREEWRRMDRWELDEGSGQPAGPGVRGHELACLEGVLLLAREPLGSRKLAQLASLADGTKARTLVRQLNRRYDEENCAFRVMEVAGGFQLMTRPKFAPWLRRLQASEMEVRLSGPAMETLAVVAYRQPVLRADIEAIRGVQCGEILRQLMERDVVRIAGRSEDLGRPFLYGTTRRFLRLFGLRHLDELPRPEELRSSLHSPPTEAGGEVRQSTKDHEVLTQPTYFHTTGGEANVKTAATKEFTAQDVLEQEATNRIDDLPPAVLDLAPKDDEDLEDEDEDFDDEDDEDEDLEDDEDLEEDEWEEVDDEDEDEDLEDEEYEEEEEEDWDEEEDDDWDEDEEDDDDDWDEDEDEEEEGEDWE